MMDNFVGNLFDLDWKLMVVHMFQMVIAFVLVLPVGYNRENSRQNIGLRTFPLVSLASCSFALLGFEVQGDDPSAMGRLEIAVLISVFMVGIFYFVSPLKQKLSKDNDDV